MTTKVSGNIAPEEDEGPEPESPRTPKFADDSGTRTLTVTELIGLGAGLTGPFKGAPDDGFSGRHGNPAHRGHPGRAKS